MTRYIAKRVFWGVVTLVLFVTALFFLVNILMPGDFMTQFRLGLSAEQRAEMAAQLGLDRSLWAQYWDWMSGMATGDLGTAFVGSPVATLVTGALATSLLLFLAGILIAFPIGNLLGRVGAWKRSGPFLGITTLIAVVAFTAFPPSLAFVLQRGAENAASHGTFLTMTQLRVGEWGRASPFAGFGGLPDGETALPSPTDILWEMVLAALAVLVLVLVMEYLLRRIRRRGLPGPLRAILVVGLTWAAWVLLGIGWRALDLLGVLLLPVVGVVLLFYGEIQLVTEAAMEEAIDDDYVTTARAKGLEERQIRDRHAARAAILPVLSRLVVSIPYFLAGLTILEQVFNVPGGLGNLLFGAVRNQDNAVVVGTLVVVGVFSLLARLVMDVLYAVLDPRIRYGSGKLEVGGG
ncbi:MAG: ABC transporter permease [Actinobacteria bacterium]|nr:ABC transporter permease [Actinomycetota bacterium]